MQTAAKSVPLFIAGRFFGGLGVGGNSCIIPIYLAEWFVRSSIQNPAGSLMVLSSSPKKFRGAIIATYQWAITIGLLLAAIVTNSTQDRPGSSAYLIPIALQFFWGLVLGVGTYFLPESYRWLIKVGRRNDAATSLARFAGQSPTSLKVVAELDEITRNLDEERAHGLHSYLDCFRLTKNKMRLRTVTGILIQCFQQLTGSKWSLMVTIILNLILEFGSQFHFLLWHHILQKLRYPGPLHHSHRNQRRQCRNDHPRNIWCRALRSTPSLARRCHWHVPL